MTPRHGGFHICSVILVFLPGPVTAEDALTTYGDVGKLAIPAAAAALSLFNDDADGLKQLFVSGVATAGATYALKYSIRETRPDGGRHSFPSGHTSLAFTGAAYVHRRYGWQWGIPFELAAAIVAYSRVDARRHYWYDVVASAGIAHLSAYFLADHRDVNVRLFPLGGGHRPGFGIVSSMRF